jgi:hypothetical protein
VPAIGVALADSQHEGGIPAFLTHVVETLSTYTGLSVLYSFLTIFLQQVAGYNALQSGLATVPVTLRDVDALAPLRGARRPPRATPIHECGAASRRPGDHSAARMGEHVLYVTDLFPGLLVFSLGLSMTVAPLTETAMAEADESDAGIASAINNAVARITGLPGVSVSGVLIAGTLAGDTFAANAASVHAFHDAMLVCAGLLAAGGIIGALGIENPKAPEPTHAGPKPPPGLADGAVAIAGSGRTPWRTRQALERGGTAAARRP